MPINQRYTKAASVPLEYNEPSKCHVYKLRDRTHAANTASWMTIAGQLVEGVGDVFFCKEVVEKLFFAHKKFAFYIHYLLHSRPTNFWAKEAWKKKKHDFFCQLPLFTNATKIRKAPIFHSAIPGT